MNFAHLFVEFGVFVAAFVVGFFAMRLSASKLIGLEAGAPNTAMTDGDVKARFRYLEIGAALVAFALLASVGLWFAIASAAWQMFVLPALVGVVLGVLRSYNKNLGSLKRLH